MALTAGGLIIFRFVCSIILSPSALCEIDNHAGGAWPSARGDIVHMSPKSWPIAREYLVRDDDQGERSRSNCFTRAIARSAGKADDGDQLGGGNNLQ